MLKTLFKRNVNGTINQWSVIVENDGYWTEYGQVGGVITKSDKVFVTAKNIGRSNATTLEEQALKEAQSLWKKKKKSENFVDNIEDVDQVLFNPPMLAQTYDGKFNANIKYTQPKLDGIRCNISLINNEVVALSRKNHPFYSVNHIKEVIESILREHPTLHIDGELYNHELHSDFNKIVSLVKKEKISDEALLEIRKYVRYNVYDLWDDANPNMLFSERNALINELFQGLDFIDIVPTYQVNNEGDIEEYWAKFVGESYEGAILRLDGIYEHKRSKNLLKYKKFNDDEFPILDICEGKIKGHAEYAIIALPNGNICKATLSFTDEECMEILKNKENIIGKLASVKYFGYTNDGKLRFPIFKSIRDYE